MDDMPEKIWIERDKTSWGGMLYHDSPNVHSDTQTEYTRTDTIASHPDVKRLVAAFAEIQKGLQLHEKRVVSASEFVIATQILMARIGPTLEQLTGDTPTNGEGS